MEAFVDEDKYKAHLERSLTSADDSVIPTLEQYDTPQKKWRLRIIARGIAVNTTIGFGPFRLGMAPKLRAIFTNSPKPPPRP